MSDEESRTVKAAYAALVERDWATLRLQLHPYLHWTGKDGLTVRGRVKVMDMLAARVEAPDRPASVELRDGQIYRWRST